MPKERKAHHELTNDEVHARSCSSSTTSIQAAAAWAWFQHGEGTTSKPEGTRLAQRQQTGLNCGIVRPSRFKIEAENRMVSATDHDSRCRKPSPGETLESGTQRRHSFHNELLRTPTLIASSPPSIDHDIKRWSCSSDCEAISLFDSFEREAVSKQLEETRTGGRTVPTSSAASSWAGGDQAGASPPARLKFPGDNHRPDSRKIGGMRDQSESRYKHENHHHHHDHPLLHQFFHFRFPAPFCNSIDIANSNVNILHTSPAEGAPKKPRHKKSHEADPFKHSQYSGQDTNPDHRLVNHPEDEHNSHKKVHKLPHNLADLYSKLMHLPQSLLRHHVDHRSNSELRTNHHHFHHHKHLHHHHHHYHHLHRHHHDVHQLHAENAPGLKLEQEIFHPQYRGVEYPPIIDDHSRLLAVPRLVYHARPAKQI